MRYLLQEIKAQTQRRCCTEAKPGARDSKSVYLLLIASIETGDFAD